MKNYEEMTVKELREESRSKGLTLQLKGRKFTKPELIERLKEQDAKESEKTEPEQKNTEINVIKPEQELKKPYAETLEEIENKYGGRKAQVIYDDMKVGSYVVFVHYVEAINGNIYKILRKAKVTAINRKKEMVRVETLFGTQVELYYDELLWIVNGNKEYRSFPIDINNYIWKHSKKGRMQDVGK